MSTRGGPQGNRFDPRCNPPPSPWPSRGSCTSATWWPTWYSARCAGLPTV